MDEFERRISAAFAAWKSRNADLSQLHPDDEAFACFFDGMLSPEEEGRIRKHILSCPACCRLVKACLHARFPAEDLPPDMVERARRLLERRLDACVMDVVVRLSGAFLQLESAIGDVLVGQEVIPAGVFRSRQARDFKDGLTVFKDFKDLRIELRIDVKDAGFTITVSGKEKETQKAVPGMRMSLAQGDRELESYRSDTGKVIFEHVRAGKYTIAAFSQEETRAVLFLEIIA